MTVARGGIARGVAGGWYGRRRTRSPRRAPPPRGRPWSCRCPRAPPRPPGSPAGDRSILGAVRQELQAEISQGCQAGLVLTFGYAFDVNTGVNQAGAINELLAQEIPEMFANAEAEVSRAREQLAGSAPFVEGAAQRLRVERPHRVGATEPRAGVTLVADVVDDAGARR